MTDESRQSKPLTAGELRRLLEEQGNPWTVDPQLSDDEPLPDYDRGGELIEEVVEERGVLVSDTADITEILRQHPPSNPFLQARWAEIGLSPTDETPTEPPRRWPRDDAVARSDERQEDER